MKPDPLPQLSLPARAIPARAGLRRPTELPEYLPARMLNEFVYCPRLFFYEWVEGLFAHSVDTVEGGQRHEKLGETPQAMPAPGEEAPERFHARSVSLSSETHRLTAVLDLVEGSGTGATPVDYKHGAPKRTDDGIEAWPADRAQVCVQAIILRENGYACDEAIVYYDQTRQRVRVPIDEALVAATLAALAEARALAARGTIPSPLVDSPKCPRCSLVGICLPDETVTALGWHEREDPAHEQPLLFPDAEAETRPFATPPTLKDVRRLVPARDDLRPLYVTGYGLSIGRSGEALEVREKGKVVQKVRLHEISQVNVFGNATVTAGAIDALVGSDKPVAYFSTGGWFYGMTMGLGLKNVFLRLEQFRKADDERFSVLLARAITATKIRNQRTLLQRNHEEPPAQAIERLKQLARQAEAAASLETLLGIEGTAARVYFEHFGGMLKAEDADERPTFDFTTRNRRPPRDPVNALLSLAYSFLARDLTIICQAVGFDPFVGFYHQPRFGRPALALDLMEGFRPLVADSAVLSAINTRMVGPGDFLRVGPAVSLTASGRKGFIRAYEQRMDTLVTHPLFGYRVSYRRVLEIQARLLARVVTGELPHYPGFETR